MVYAAITTGTICRDCAHFLSFSGERDGWEAALGACHHWHGRVQHANSQPRRFGGGEWTPATGEVAGKMAVSSQTALGRNHYD